MIQDEIRAIYGKNEIDNNYKLWLDCYRGESPWLGGENLESLNLCSSISSELARLTTIEFESELDLEIYQEVVENARKFVEYGLALGGLILKPYKLNDKLAMNYLTPDMYLILGFSVFGEINHVVFIDRIYKNKRYFTRLEEHEQINDYWKITNTCYESNNYYSLGKKISLKEVNDWKNIKEAEVIKVDFPLFSYFKNPMANNLDLQSFEGVSCFSRALSLIQDADEQYQRILWEFKGTEIAIDADITVIKENGELPHGKERLFRNLGLDQKDGFYEVFSPDIRDSSLFNGLNKILRRIEFTVGLAYGTISEVDEVEKSATEVKASKQRSYSTVVDIQKELQKTLENLINVINFYLNSNYEASFSFDDSLVVDAESEQKIRLQEVSMGLIKPEEYLMWRYGVTEKEAQKMMPEVIEDEEETEEE